MSRPRKPIIDIMRERHDQHTNPAAFPSPTPDDILRAVEVMWGKEMDQATADAIGGTEKCAQAMRQFLEGYPVTAAMTFAMTFGYMIRVQVERQERRVELVTVTQ